MLGFPGDARTRSHSPGERCGKVDKIVRANVREAIAAMTTKPTENRRMLIFENIHFIPLISGTNSYRCEHSIDRLPPMESHSPFSIPASH